MATPAFHVACAYVGSPTGRTKDRALISAPVWSESPNASTATTNAVPADSDFRKGDPVFQVNVTADSYVAIGKTPDPSQSPRLLVKASELTTIYCQPGDKIAYVAA